MNGSSTPRKGTLVAGAAGLLAAGALGGAVLAGATAASADTSTPSGYSSTAAGDEGGQRTGDFPEHGTAAHESQEKTVTGADATRARAAAIKSVGSGTAGEVTTDMTGKGYEVTVTKSDGSKVEVRLDQSFGVSEPGRVHG